MTKSECKVENCCTVVKTRGFCSKHYRQVMRTGHPNRMTEDHGDSNTKLYAVWSAINQRCNNQKNKNFSRYGGRGIKNMFKSFDDFKNTIQGLEHYGLDGFEIDRKDNNKSYEAGNIRLVKKKQNMNNQSTSLLVRFTEDELSEICEMYDRLNISRVKLADATGISKTSIDKLLRGEVHAY